MLSANPDFQAQNVAESFNLTLSISAAVDRRAWITLMKLCKAHTLYLYTCRPQFGQRRRSHADSMPVEDMGITEMLVKRSICRSIARSRSIYMHALSCGHVQTQSQSMCDRCSAYLSRRPGVYRIDSRRNRILRRLAPSIVPVRSGGISHLLRLTHGR